jgi:hypothetical protein
VLGGVLATLLTLLVVLLILTCGFAYTYLWFCLYLLFMLTCLDLLIKIFAKSKISDLANLECLAKK